MDNTNQQGDINVVNDTIADPHNDDQIDVRLNLYQNLHGEGLKYTFHGVVYQLILLAYAAYRADKKNLPFYLISEAKEFEKFDDLVIDCHNNIIFLQAKHTSINNSYSAKDFCKPIDVKDNDASLAKYYDSWIRLKASPFSKMSDGKPKQSRYIFFTNRDVRQSQQFLEDYPITLEMDEFFFLNPSQESKTLRFKKGQHRQQFIDAIYTHSKEIEEYELDIEPISNQAIHFSITVEEQTLSKELNIQQLHKEIKEVVDLLKNPITDRNPNGEPKPKKRKYKFQTENYDPISIRVEALIALAQNKELLHVLAQEMKIHPKELTALKQEHQISTNQALIILTGALDQNINQFLDEFEIKIKQPNVTELQELLLQEMTIDNHIGPRQIYHALNNMIMNWIKNRKECVLKFTDMKKFINAEVADIQHIIRLGSNKLFEEEYENCRLSFSNHQVYIEDLSAFLTSSTNGDNIAVVTGIGIRARVYATIRSLLNKQKIVNSQWLFLDFNSLKDQDSLDIFAAPSLKFAVIDCLQIQIAQNIDTVKSRLKIATNLYKKKIVLLMKDDVTEAILTQLLKANDDENIQIAYNPVPITRIKVDRLAIQKIQEICQPLYHWYLNLGGKDYLLKDAINDTSSNFSTMISDLDFLCEIACNLKQQQSTTKHVLPYGIYVQNDLIQGNPVYDLIDLIHNCRCNVIIIDNINNEEHFVQQLDRWLNMDNKQTGENGNQQRFTDNPKQFNDEGIKYILTSDKHISNLQSYIQAKIVIYICSNWNWLQNANIKCSFICISCMNNNLRNAKVAFCSPDQLNLPKPMFHDIDQGSKIDNPKDHFLKSCSTISIISAKAGYGKSSFCLATRQQWINQQFSNIKWLIYILLPQLNLASSEKFEAALTHAITQVSWKNWEISLVLKDLESKSNVTLLLDAFDEVKDENHLKIINKWIDQYSGKADIIVTTRPHAFNKISLIENNVSCSYYGLKEYTSAQQLQYIREYINAILKEKYNINQEQIDKYREQMSQQINHKLISIKTKVPCLYGIPLETYHFCEIITPRLVSHFNATNQFDLEGAYAEMENITTISLIQKFIATKLQLFLTKHLNISSTTIVQWKHQIYGLTSSYLELLMIFAYRQEFNLEFSFLGHYLRRYFYNTAMINDLNDTGFVCVYQTNQLYLKFNHDTYQDYFAALFILKGILIPDQLCQHIKNMIGKYRYNPRYRMLLSLAAHLSMTGDKLIPGYNTFNSDHQLQLWEIIAGQSDDLLGAAETKLFHTCLREYSCNQRQILAHSLTDKVWAQQLIKCVNQAPQQQTFNSINDDFDKYIPVLRASSSNFATINEYTPINMKDAKEKLQNKTLVVNCTKSFLKNGILSSADLATLFQQIIKEDRLDWYWDIDGGFSAMALLGNDFKQPLADYFIDRIKGDPSWRTNPALNAIYSLYRDDLQLQSKHACLNVIPYFIKYYKYLVSKDQLYALINRSYTIIFNYVFELPNYISEIRLHYEILDRYDYKFQYPILLFRSLLWIAIQVGYAVKINENDQIQFTHESVTTLTLNHDIQSQIFAKIQKGIFEHLRLFTYKAERLEQDDDCADLMDQDVKNKLEYSVYSELSCHNMETLGTRSIDHLVQYAELTNKIYCNLDRFGLMTQNIADILLQYAEEHQNHRSDTWPRDGGILAIGFVGRYFNRDFANYLIQRSEWWEDNFKLCKKALNSISKTLAAVTDKDRDNCYISAIEAYNFCYEQLEQLNKDSSSECAIIKQTCNNLHPTDDI